MRIINKVKLFLYSNKKRIFMVLVLLTLTAVVTTLFLKKTTYKTSQIVYESVLNEENLTKEEEKTLDYLYVDIKGEVQQPGVYSLEEGKRVVDAINKAGGITENADTSVLNLSLELSDEMVIIVYSKEEIAKYVPISDYLEKKSEICQEEPKNDACITNSNSEIVSNIQEETKLETKQEDTKDNKQTEVKSSKININTANLEELMTLNKIGEKKAEAIIEYRTKIGKFKTIEEIKNVNGIGDKLFETIKDNITI